MKGVVTALGLLVVLTGAAQARAGDGPPDEARRRFDAGSALYDVGDYTAAIRQFEAARALHPHPAFTYNIARCYERMERWAEAAQEYERYLPSLGGSVEAIALAHRIRSLKERRAMPTPPPPPRLEATPPPAPAPPPPPPPIAAPPPPIAAPATPSPPARSRLWIGGLVLGVVAVGAIGAGTGLYLDARNQYDQLTVPCERRQCGPADWSGASAIADAAYAMWAVGGIVAAADVALWVLVARQRAPAPRALVAPTLGGVAVWGSF